VLIIVQLVVLAAFLIWLGIAGEVGALISGVLGLAFWVGVVALGLVAPLLLQFRALKGAGEAKGAAVLVSPILVLLGGFVLRAVVVIGGQI
jgi:formate-dependent nitrite reductase membrane component NrfD